MNPASDIPLLCHHQKSLDKQSLHDLGTDALEQAQNALVLDDVLHNFDKCLEWLAITDWRWFRLEADFGDNKRLGYDGRKSL